MKRGKQDNAAAKIWKVCTLSVYDRTRDSREEVGGGDCNSQYGRAGYDSHAASKRRRVACSVRYADLSLRSGRAYFSSRCFFSLIGAHSSASAGASFFSMIGFQTFASSAFS